jgi:hypothetical protein
MKTLQVLVLLFVVVAALAVPAAAACAQAPVWCARCLEAITFDYIVAAGRSFHSQCFVCPVCDVVILEKYCVDARGFYHTSCYDRCLSATCVAGGHRITGAWCEDYWGNTYCSQCAETAVLCHDCGRPVSGKAAGDGAVTPPGRRQICAACRSSMEKSERDATNLMLKVARHLERWGVDVGCSDIVILHVDSDKTYMWPESPEHCIPGVTDNNRVTTPNDRMKCESINVCLLYGMSECQMKAALAHELVHVWLYRKGKIGTAPELCEGNCNYASHPLLIAVGAPVCNTLAALMMVDPHTDYGVGFREVKRFAEVNAVTASLRELTRSTVRPVIETATAR